MADVFLGLGSNLGDRGEQLRRGLQLVARHPEVVVRDLSTARETAPVGAPPQPRFVNAVARLETSLAPHRLLGLLRRVEARRGRQRSVPRGPRTLDLDLLLYGGHREDSQRLTLPHPRMHERWFVLAPLAELAPRLRLDDGASVARRAHELAQAGAGARAANWPRRDDACMMGALASSP